MKKNLAFISDMHLREHLPVDINQSHHWKTVLLDAIGKQVDGIIIGGDISDPLYYEDFFGSLSEFKGNVYLIPGNHDKSAELLRFFSNPENPDSPELYYSLEDENFLYVFLDSSSSKISHSQLHWLESKFEGNGKKILIFVHHPIYEVDSYVDRKYPLENRDDLRRILESQQREAFIFCGHCHCEDETGSGPVSQFTTPAVSYQVKKGTESLETNADYYAYRIIHLENANLRTELISFKP